jgi:hypothetical protein
MCTTSGLGTGRGIERGDVGPAIRLDTEVAKCGPRIGALADVDSVADNPTEGSTRKGDDPCGPGCRRGRRTWRNRWHGGRIGGTEARPARSPPQTSLIPHSHPGRDAVARGRHADTPTRFHLNQFVTFSAGFFTSPASKRNNDNIKLYLHRQSIFTPARRCKFYSNSCCPEINFDLFQAWSFDFFKIWKFLNSAF